MSASLISLIMTLVFVVLLVAGFLVGLWRGLRKSLISLVASIVGVLLAFFITPALVGTVLGISVEINGEVVPLSDIALQLAKDNPDLALLIETNEGFKALLAGIPAAVANAALLILVTILIELLFYFIYLIFSKFVFKKKILEKKYRWAGAGVGLAKMFIVTLLAFMPFAGLIGTASYIVGEPRPASAAETQIDDSRFLQNDIPNSVKEIASGLENNVLVKICGVFGMDNAMFDYYGTINVDGANVKIREELINTYDTADSIYQVSKVVNGKGSLSQVNFDSLSVVIDKTVNGNLFKQVVCPMLGDIIINSDNYDFTKELAQSQPDAMTYLKQTLEAEISAGGSYHSYFASDLNKVFAIVRGLAESGIIDGINGKSTEEAIEFIALDENKEVIKDNINKLFDIKLAKAFASSAVQALSDNLLAEEDRLDIISTLDWTDDDWKGVSQNLGGVIDNVATLANEIDFESEDLVKSLLSSSSETDLTVVATNLGGAVDGLRTNALLQSTDGKNVIDSLLAGENVGLTLPTENLTQKTTTGKEEVEIQDYEDLINFILPALEEIKENDLYSILTEGTEAKTMITSIADKLSVEGNEDMLANILLPLVQIDKTKSIVVDAFSTSNLIDLSGLTTFDDWDKDLSYIRQMIVALHKTQIESSAGQSTALSLVLDGNMEELINGLPAAKIDSIFKPLFWGKSTATLKSTIVEKMKEEIETIIEADANPIDMSIDGITFEEGEEEDQTEEFINIVKDLLEIAKTYNPETGIDGVDKTLLGGMLDKMKENANRTTNGKTEEGIFGGANGAFVRICDYAKQEYFVEINAIPTVLQYASLLGISTEDQARYQSYYDNMTQEKYQNINFTQMLADFATLTELKNQIPSGL